MTVVTMLGNGNFKAKKSATIVSTGAGDYPVSITFEECRGILSVDNINLSTSPLMDPGSPVNTKISGNTVELTIAAVPAGGTITCEVEVTGW